MASYTFFKRHTKNLLAFLFIASFLFSLRIYSYYFNNLDFGDEYDNFVSSWLVLNGQVLYKDFFSHQFPLLTLIGVPLEAINHSKLIYRLFTLIITFSFFGYIWFKLKGILRLTIIPFMLFSSYAISLYAGQQFEDGPIWAVVILGAFLLVVNSKDKVLSRGESVILASLTFFLSMSSPAHLLALFGIYMYYFLSGTKSLKNNIKANWQNLKYFSITILIFFFLTLIYFLFTNSLADFYKNVFEYNGQYYIKKISKEYTGIGFFDFLISSFWETYIYVLLLAKEEGAALITFLKSAKFLVTPQGLNVVYVKTIFTDLYNNFFSIDMIILIFYVFGFIRFLLLKQFLISVLIFALFFLSRLRMDTGTHLAPFYLFSYWLMSAGVVYSTGEIVSKRRIMQSTLIVFTLLVCASVFVSKHWYSFGQTSFNRFGDPTEKTVRYLKESNNFDPILVFRGDSARYNYNSNALTGGYFVNYFPWYASSERLEGRMLKDIRDFDGSYLIVNKREWDDYFEKKISSWRSVYFDEISKKFKIVQENDGDYVMDLK